MSLLPGPNFGLVSFSCSVFWLQESAQQYHRFGGYFYYLICRLGPHWSTKLVVTIWNLSKHPFAFQYLHTQISKAEISLYEQDRQSVCQLFPFLLISSLINPFSCFLAISPQTFPIFQFSRQISSLSVLTTKYDPDEACKR